MEKKQIYFFLGFSLGGVVFLLFFLSSWTLLNTVSFMFVGIFLGAGEMYLCLRHLGSNRFAQFFSGLIAAVIGFGIALLVYYYFTPSTETFSWQIDPKTYFDKIDWQHRFR